ncbi:MAG: hypothetical protein WCJ70_04500 [bacterium]
MDDLDHAIKQSDSHTPKASARAEKSMMGSLGKSVTTSIVRNVVGIITRAVMKSLMGGSKKSSSRSSY